MTRLAQLISATVLNCVLAVRTAIWTLPVLIVRLLCDKWIGAETEGNKNPYLIMLSFIEWDGSWQRPQHLASDLSGTMDVVCCAPVRAHNLRPARSWSLLFYAREQSSARLTILRPLLLPAENRFAFIRAINAVLLYDHLQREIRRRGDIPSVLLTNSPFFSLPFSWLPARLRAYDVMDELVRFPWAPRDAREQERLVVAQSDLVTTGTKSLSRLKCEQYADLACEAHYASCGVDAQHFAAPPAGTPLPPDIASLPRPIIGFFGAINERVDPAILSALADGFPEGTIALIGPVYQGFEGLRNKSNVHFLGLKPYAQLPLYQAAFDCAIIPYRLSDGIEFVQPVKVLEYLAGGRPVVSTRIPDVVELYSEQVRIASDAQDFVRLAREAVAEGNARSAEYAAVSSGRTWQDMANEFSRLMREAAAKQQTEPHGVTHLIHGIHLGGAEQVVVDLCRHYSPERFRGSVVCLGHGQRVQDRLREKGVASRIVEMRGKWDLGVAFRLIPALRASKTELIHTHTSRTNLVARLVSRTTGLPVVTTVHTAIARDINDMGRSNRVNAAIERLTRHWSARLVTVSDHNRAELLADGADPSRVTFIPNGVEIPENFLKEEELQQARGELQLMEATDGVVGMLASMRPRKGPEVLLRAMPRVLAAFPGARLLMVGSGEFVESVDYLDTLRSLARELGISEKVIFAGHRDDTRRMMALMDVFVLPSLFGEGMPLVLLEAMAAGKPTIATRTEGNDEVVRHGETGLLVKAGDSQELAEAIIMLLRDPEMRASMGQTGRKYAETQYSVQTMTRRYEEVYASVGFVTTETKRARRE